MFAFGMGWSSRQPLALGPSNFRPDVTGGQLYLAKPVVALFQLVSKTRCRTAVPCTRCSRSGIKRKVLKGVAATPDLPGVRLDPVRAERR